MSDDRSIDDLLASDEPDDRIEGVRRLGGAPRREAVDGLLRALRDPDDGVSAEAATLLGDLATEGAIPALVREYARPDRFPGTHPIEIPYSWVLEELEAGDRWEPLVEALEAAGEPEVVNRCRVLLAELEDPRARPALERLAELLAPADRAEDEIRELEARGSELLAASPPGAPVEFPSAEDLEEGVLRAMKRAAAEWVLDQLDEPEGAEPEAPSTLDEIREAFREGGYEERRHAERRLWGWVGAVDTGDLVDALRDDHRRISSAAAKALGTRGVTEAVPDLVREVARPERSIAPDVASYPYAERSDLRHSEHARALVRIGDPASVELLLEALEGADSGWARWEMLWVLGRLGDPRALEAVEAAVERLREARGTGRWHRERISNAEEALYRLREASGEGGGGPEDR